MMKKLLYRFNWAMFIVFLIAVCSLDADSWTAEVVAFASLFALVSGASMLEQIKVRDEE
jgi:hypothetical protein